MIVPVMARAEESAAFLDEILVLLNHLGADFECAVAIGGNVEVMGKAAVRAELDGAVVGAHGDGRIDHSGEGGGLKFDLVAGFALDGKRGAIPPTGGNAERGLVLHA